MPAWLVQAMRLLLGGLGAGAAFEIGQSAIESGTQGGERPGRSDINALARLGNIALPGDPFGGGGAAPRRRRRRRALTASDKADIAFIVGLLGPAAGKQFSTTLAARPR